ncbi:protein phosphatase 1 regulatory subunit 37 [Cololabis saira]|uniref:protein phosphatase 1 regulatory subunit 37 n=1 Tax=Cololabis saira TaxID=129043 RepID=UPI002AD5694E|nr:protein phosphatase 1 regulatory subunit 37 [Cololabis saira]
MNIEDQCLDLCNVKSKSNVDGDYNTTNSTEGVTPRISELMTDGNAEKQNIVLTEASQTYLMPQLTDNLQAAEKDNHQAEDTLEIDEVNGNRKSCAQETLLRGNPTDVIFSNDEQNKHNSDTEKMIVDKDSDSARLVMELGDNDGDMDIGVDLSLDESGVLETESAKLCSLSDNILDSESTPQDVPTGVNVESLSDANKTSSSEASSTDQAGLYPTVEEEDEKHKPSGKRVTFPLDDDIVSGAVEPKDPWRHAQNVTVEEILSSYKQACQKLNCKPIPKVIKQIQELKDLTQRNECFDLKGEKLDYKACESLEEILKRVQFKVIDLEQTNLDEDGASALFDMIEYYESATHLNISFNKHIGTRGWQAAAHMMRKTSSLQYLDARNTPLLDHSAPFVARALRISGSLAVLHLENAGLSGRPLMLLATALKMNMNLRELYLADNKLNGLQDSAQLGNLLKFNYNIQILDLRNNHILDSGLAYLCEGLKEQRKGLVTLVLWNNQLTHNGMSYLAAALPCTQSLETLNLGHNAVGNEGVHKLKDGLIANRSVLRLGLASTKLSCEGAVAVAEFIAESPRLLRLDLRENEIKTGGLMALSLALKVNTSLLRLDLDREPKKETVKSFIDTQRALLAEIQNGCKRNFILAKEKEENEQKMRQSASMAEIATEDGTGQEEEDELQATDGKGEKDEKRGEGGGDSIGTAEQASSQLGAGSQKNIPVINLESDSDTEDEDQEEVVTRSHSISNSSVVSNQTAPQTCTGVTQSPLSASAASSLPPAAPAGGPSLMSGITVTEAPVPPGTPPSPGRCISVSSPGRGHKIFMVTRVESPPEQQLLLQSQTSSPVAPIQTKEAAKSLVDISTPMTQQTQPPPTSPTPTQTQLTPEDVKGSSPPPPTNPQKAEESPVAGLESELNTAKIHTQAPQSANPPTVGVTGEPLDPDVTDPSLQTPALPSNSSSVQVEASQLAEGMTESSESPRPEPTAEGNKEGEEEVSVQYDRTVAPSGCKQSEELNESQTSLPSQQQLSTPALEQPQSERASDETPPPNQQEKQEGPVSLAENEEPSSTLKEQTSQEESRPKHQLEAGEQEVAPVHSVQADESAPSVIEGGAEESNPAPQGAPGAASTQPEENPDSSFEEDESADESSADECFVEALEGEAEGSTLPNGLKPEFSIHLLDTESPKPGSCVMEHVSATCGQELEELLLEASLETGRDMP